MNKLIFVLIHVSCVLVLWCGASWIAVATCIATYSIRMFAITAGYHRLFSHRSYNTSRFFQFLLGLIGTTSVQRGPLWWAANHRHHHRHADTESDVHSPRKHGVWWAHVGWILSDAEVSDPRLVKDLLRLPELVILDKYHFIPPLIFLFGTFLFGEFLNFQFPGLHTNGVQMMVWGALISTVLLYHCTFAINSFAHLLGTRRFQTNDDSTNSLLLALVTLGEGWHNNHHRYPGSERQGFYWWEIDITHYVLTILSFFGIVWDLRTPPARLYQEAREQQLAQL